MHRRAKAKEKAKAKALERARTIPKAKEKAKVKRQKVKVKEKVILHHRHHNRTQNPSQELPQHSPNVQRGPYANTLISVQVATMEVTAPVTSFTWHRQKHKHTSAKIRPRSIKSRPKIANEPIRLIDDTSIIIAMILPIRINIMALMCHKRIHLCTILVVGLRTMQKHKNTTT